jgi:erythromycin esterase-like protein
MNYKIIHILVIIFIFFNTVKSTAQIQGVSKFDTSNVSNLLNKLKVDSFQIVLLGEENHYDGVAMKINQKIITELVQKHGFKSLLIESDFESLYQINLGDKREKEYSVNQNIYNCWSKVVEAVPIFELERKGLLHIYGFDSRLRGTFIQKHCLDSGYYQLFFSNFNPSEHEKNLFYTTFKSITSNEFKDTTSETRRLEFIELIKKSQAFYKDTLSIEYYSLENIKNYLIQICLEKKSSLNYTIAREENMIRNVEFLLKTKFKNEKVILLGANIHVQPGVIQLNENYAKENCGDFLKKYYKTLSILPMNYAGKRRNPIQIEKLIKIEKPRKKTLAGKLHKLKYEFALIDLHKVDKTSLIYRNEVQLPNLYGDYLIFIDQTEPSTLIQL